VYLRIRDAFKKFLEVLLSILVFGEYFSSLGRCLGLYEDLKSILEVLGGIVRYLRIIAVFLRSWEISGSI
jgi:hypothetical protein